MVRFRGQVLAVFWAASGIAVGPLCAQGLDDPPASEPPAPGAWTLGLGWNRYTENFANNRVVMELQGPEFSVQRSALRWGHWESSALLQVAQQNYNSPISGHMQGAPSVHGSVEALYPLPLPSSFGAWSAGPAVQLYWNDLRGTTSFGHRGYERMGMKAWGRIAYSSTHHRLDLNTLLVGLHHSNLSQAGEEQDIVNHQRLGWSMGWTYMFEASKQRSWGLQGRWTYVGVSDQVGLGRWYEPQNTTWQWAVLRSW